MVILVKCYAAYYKLDWKDVLQQFHFGNSEVILLSPQDSSSSPDNNNNNNKGAHAQLFETKQYNP